MGQRERVSLDLVTCAYAAESGHLEVLKWARENGCPGSADYDDDDYFFDDDEEGEERDSDSLLESDD